MRTAARTGLLLVAAGQAEVGVWGEVSPHGFFRTFPGAGRHWLVGLGPYDEHLVRDYAAAELGLAVLLALAALWFTRQVVIVAAAAFLAATIPHFLFHLTTTGDLSTADNLASLGAFVVELLVVAAALTAALRHPSTKENRDVTPRPRPAQGSGPDPAPRPGHLTPDVRP